MVSLWHSSIQGLRWWDGLPVLLAIASGSGRVLGLRRALGERVRWVVLRMVVDVVLGNVRVHCIIAPAAAEYAVFHGY